MLRKRGKWLLAIVVSGFAIHAQAQIVPGHLKVIDLTDQGIDGVALELKGGIAYPLADEYAQALAAIKPGRTVFLSFNSEGGVVEEGQKIIQLLKEQKFMGRQFVSLVNNGQVCASMCVPIYMQAQERRADEVAAFMFHGTYAGWSTNVPDAIKSKALLKLFTEAGVSQAFLDVLWEKGAFTQPGEYWMSARELWDEKTGIVTHLQPRHTKYAAWVAPFDPNIRPR